MHPSTGTVSAKDTKRLVLMNNINNINSEYREINNIISEYRAPRSFQIKMAFLSLVRGGGTGVSKNKRNQLIKEPRK